jgi:hypothetical protein
VNSCVKEEYDWEEVQRRAREAAENQYRRVYEVLQCPQGSWRTYATIVDECEAVDPSTAREKAREIYWAQPEFEGKRSDLNNLCSIFGGPDDFHGTLEEYVEANTHDAPFAFIVDRKWCQKGEMGWWGMVSDKKDLGTWREEFTAMLKSLPDDAVMTVVDCHI